MEHDESPQRWLRSRLSEETATRKLRPPKKATEKAAGQWQLLIHVNQPELREKKVSYLPFYFTAPISWPAFQDAHRTPGAGRP